MVSDSFDPGDSFYELEYHPPHEHFTRFQRRHGAMTPENQILLDELTKRLDERDTRWEKRFDDYDDKWERRFSDLTVSNDARITKLERVAGSLESWRPDIDGTVDDLRLEVNKLNKH